LLRNSDTRKTQKHCFRIHRFDNYRFRGLSKTDLFLEFLDLKQRI